MTAQTLGDCRERSSECEYLTLAFSPLSAPLRSRWRNNGLSADFLGDYVTTFLPAESEIPGSETRQNEIRHAVTYIANELLENAMKFHERQHGIPIGIHLELTSGQITVSVSNVIAVGQAQRYREFAQRLLQGNAQDLLLKQQEEGAQSDQSHISGLGLLTLVSDYEAGLGWNFETDPLHPEIMTVTTNAVLLLKIISGVTV